MVTHCHEAVDVHKNILILSQLLGIQGNSCSYEPPISSLKNSIHSTKINLVMHFVSNRIESYRIKMTVGVLSILHQSKYKKYCINTSYEDQAISSFFSSVITKYQQECRCPTPPQHNK
jgi:hypothetical protein